MKMAAYHCLPLLSLVASLALSACSPDDSPLGPPGARRMDPDRVTEPGALIEAAVAGVQMRGEQDQMLQVEAQLPGFGGFFVDEGQRMVVYLKHPAGAGLALVRDVLARQYSNRPEPRVREVMGHLAETRVIEGQYSLSELIAIENSIARNFDQIPGFSAVGVSILRNRVKLGFVDAADVAAGMSAVHSLGVIYDDVSPEVWGRMHAANWGNSYRPMFGGLMISVENKSVYADTTGGGQLCSYGFTVTDSLGRSYLMTAAHCANEFHAVNGATGDTIFQGWRAMAPISVARITINPAWRIYPCPQGMDFCPLADVALATFLNGTTGYRKVGTSMYEGLNGQPSRDGTINGGGPYPLTTPVAPEWIDTTAYGIHKSGWNTGTTTGQITVPVTTGWMTLPWGAPQWGTRTIWFTNLTLINHIGWGGGDSGGPVFGGDVSPYYPLGIFIGGNGHQDANTLICDAGVQCQGLFIRWGAIENQLGIGHLNPATVQSPPSGLTGVTITGPSTINGCTLGTWTATPSGGTYPITYQWSVENSDYYTDTSNQLSYRNTGSANAIFVEVVASDARGTTAYKQFKTGVTIPGAC